MKHEALVTVARLRRLALDDASQALSRGLVAETIAATRADDAAQQIADEAAAASSVKRQRRRCDGRGVCRLAARRTSSCG